jgi:hypothetical protein
LALRPELVGELLERQRLEELAVLLAALQEPQQRQALELMQRRHRLRR